MGGGRRLHREGDWFFLMYQSTKYSFIMCVSPHNSLFSEMCLFCLHIYFKKRCIINSSTLYKCEKAAEGDVLVGPSSRVS